MLECHSAWRLKFAAQPNYIFIIANGSRCPITAQQYIFNNMHLSVWLSIWAGLSSSPSCEKCQATDSVGGLRWWKEMLCVCVSVCVVTVRQEITALLIFDREWEVMIFRIVIFVLFCKIFMNSLAYVWKDQKEKSILISIKVPIAMQSLFNFLFTWRGKVDSTFASCLFLTDCHWKTFGHVLIAEGPCLHRNVLVSQFQINVLLSENMGLFWGNSWKTRNPLTNLRM